MGKCVLCGVDCVPERFRIPLAHAPAYVGTDCPKCNSYVLFNAPIYKWNLEPLVAEETRFKIACVIREKRLAGTEGIFGIFPDDHTPTEGIISNPKWKWWHESKLLSEFPTVTTALVDRALVNLSRNVVHPMDEVERTTSEVEFLTFCRGKQLSFMRSHLEQAGLCRMHLFERRDGIGYIILQAGWERLEKKENPAESNQVFVAMWSGPKMKTIYKDGIESVVRRLGFDPLNLNLEEMNGNITNRIIEEIRKSRFLIADFTGGGCSRCGDCDHNVKCRYKICARGNVYFEAGYADGLNREVICIVDEQQSDQVHFDLQQRKFIYYKDAADLNAKLETRITETILKQKR